MAYFNLRSCTLTPRHIAHEHAFHQLILATSGVTELTIEGRGERITHERGCLIPSTYHHEYTGDGRNRTLVLDVPLASLAMVSCAGEVERLFERPRFFAVAPALHRLAEGVLPQVTGQPALHGEIATLILRALYLNLHDAELAPVSASREGRERIQVARIARYIDEHLDQPIRVEALAALCALSPGHFHACFRDAMGMTPQAYVQQRRLAHARGLIERTSHSLGTIAARVGFLDQGSFSRAYRRAYGVPPSLHRRH